MKPKNYFNLNAIGHKWVERTLFLWLPIYALFRLIREAGEKMDKKK
jgi:hypothetical protein